MTAMVCLAYIVFDDCPHVLNTEPTIVVVLAGDMADIALEMERSGLDQAVGSEQDGSFDMGSLMA